ncbi:hypothetical protein VTK56DRAFT_6981 [Thermocarpiscus australiensis]
MEQCATSCDFSLFNPHDVFPGSNDFVSIVQAHPRSQDGYATAHLSSWAADGSGDLMVPLQPTTLSMEWSEQISLACSNDPQSTAAIPSSIVEGQYFPTPPDWFHPPSFDGRGFGTDSFDSAFAHQSSGTWPPTGFAGNPRDYATLDGSVLQRDGIPSYPLDPLESEPLSPLSLSPGHQDHLARLPEYQRHSTGEFDSGYDSKKRERAHVDAEDGASKRKRGRSSSQATETNYSTGSTPLPSPPLPLRRASASDTTAASPDTAATSPDDDRDTTAAATAAATVTTSKKQPTTTTATSIPPRPRRASSNPDVQARNRAAASRYRAKTQAAFAQLEAEEREVSVRRQSLLAAADRLRGEVFQLKNELLRHADCDCPLIRDYLSHAAQQACAGLGLGLGPGSLGSLGLGVGLGLQQRVVQGQGQGQGGASSPSPSPGAVPGPGPVPGQVQQVQQVQLQVGRARQQLVDG